MEKFLVEMRNIHKSFGKVVALRGLDFSVGYNDIVGLVGDNGAGKSTLIKILTGVYPPDEGEIYIKGEKIEKHSVQNARRLGIETVYQEKALAEQHTLWRNIFMGREKVNRLGFLKIKEQKEETETLMREVLAFTSAGVSPDSIVGKLSGGEGEGVAIARALYFEADLIILDEPTMALSLAETEKVLDYVRMIKKRGKSCIFITHNLYHAYPVVDKFVILDRGRKAGEFEKKDVSLRTLTDMMLSVVKTGKL